jgi:hypothetical protein
MTLLVWKKSNTGVAASAKVLVRVVVTKSIRKHLIVNLVKVGVSIIRRPAAIWCAPCLMAVVAQL